MTLTITITPQGVLGILAIIGILLGLWEMWKIPDDDFAALIFGDEEDER